MEEVVNEEKISKKVCAVEVLKELSNSKNTYIVSIASLFLSALFSSFSSLIQYLIIFLAIIYLGYNFANSEKKIKYLKEKYNL